MIDSIFIIDDNDEVLIERHWKGLVSRLVINTYISYRHNTKNAEDLPVVDLGEYQVVTKKENDLLFLATLSTDQSPFNVLDCLQDLICILKEYIPTINKKSVTANFSTVCLVLDEVTDYGIPLIVNPSMTTGLIEQYTITKSLSNMYNYLLSRPEEKNIWVPGFHPSESPWSHGENYYLSNFMVLTILESYECTITKNNARTFSNGTGTITCSAYMNHSPRFYIPLYRTKTKLERNILKQKVEPDSIHQSVIHSTPSFDGSDTTSNNPPQESLQSGLRFHRNHLKHLPFKIIHSPSETCLPEGTLIPTPPPVPIPTTTSSENSIKEKPSHELPEHSSTNDIDYDIDNYIDSIHLHPLVNKHLFLSTNILSFTPLNSEFELMSYKIKNMDQYAKLDPLIFKHDLKWEGKTAIISFLVGMKASLNPEIYLNYESVTLTIYSKNLIDSYEPTDSISMNASTFKDNTITINVGSLDEASKHSYSYAIHYDFPKSSYPIFCRLSYMLADTTYSGLTFGHETIDNVDSHYSYSCRAKCLIHNYKLDIEL